MLLYRLPFVNLLFCLLFVLLRARDCALGIGNSIVFVAGNCHRLADRLVVNESVDLIKDLHMVNVLSLKLFDMRSMT